MNLQTVCENLPGSWSVIPINPDRFRGSIQRIDGLSLSLYEGGYGNEGKVSIELVRPVGRSGLAPSIYPKVGHGQIPDPRIKVSNKKSAEQIAKDIVRRLLPESEIVFEAANDSIRRENNFADGKTSTLFDLAKILNVTPSNKHNIFELDPLSGAGIVPFEKHGYGKVTVNSKDSVDIELKSVPKEVATQVLDAIHLIFAKNKQN